MRLHPLKFLLFLILIPLLAGISLSCGGDGSGQAQRDFEQQLGDRIDTAIGEIDTAKNASVRILELAASIQPRGISSGILIGLPETDPAAIDDFLSELGRAGDRLKEQADLPLPDTPGDCDLCSGQKKEFEQGISRALAEIEDIRQSIVMGRQVLAIREEQIQKLDDQVPKIGEEVMLSELQEANRIQAQVYGETISQWQTLAGQWQALNVDSSLEEELQKVVLVDQKLLELSQQLALPEVSLNLTVERERFNSQFKAELEEENAVSSLYRATVKRVNPRSFEVIKEELRELLDGVREGS
ncbi:MAG: hypothetical protein IBX61_02645 [Thermoleophilia bacterium]|nr:hypothetical protein [Thermoleophilia bacterium]